MDYYTITAAYFRLLHMDTPMNGKDLQKSIVLTLDAVKKTCR